MHDLLQEMIHIRKRYNNHIPTEKIKELKEKYKSILSLAESEYLENPPSKEYMEGFNLQKGLVSIKAVICISLIMPKWIPQITSVNDVFENSNANRNRLWFSGVTPARSIFVMH